MRRADTIYLLQEATLVLGLSYLLLLGGTYSGLVYYQFRLVSYLLLLVTGVGWLLWRWRRGLPGHKGLWLPLLALLLAFSVATLTSLDPRRSLTGLWQVGIAVWTFWMVGSMLAAGWAAELWVKCLLVVGAMIIGLALYTVMVWYGRWWAIGGVDHPWPPVLLRLWSLPGNPNFIAGTLNLLWPLALARLVGRRGRLARLTLAVWVGLAWVILFFTSSRAGWLGAAASLVVLGALLVAERGGIDWLKRLLRRRNLLMALTLALILAVATLGPLLYRQFTHPTHRPVMESRQQWWSPAWRAFLSSPLVGTGPLTYASRYWLENSVPPQPIFVQAHSIPLHVLSEAGLMGLAALLVASAALARSAHASWRTAEPESRVEISGALAALAGAGVHGLFDNVQMMPALAMLAALVAALATQQGGESRGRTCIPLLFLALMGLGGWSLWGYQPAAEGVALANAASLEEALPFLEEAVERDPALGLNQLHLGQVHGMLALSDPSHLGSAMAAYREGIRYDPDYAPHHANLAALLWQAGSGEEAISEMAQASRLAPGEARFLLLMGIYQEGVGDTAGASSAYGKAMELAGWVAKPAYFWRETLVRAKAWEAAAGAVVPSDPGWLALEAGDTTVAREYFAGLKAERPDSAEAYRGLAAVALAEGEQALADHYLQTGLFVGDSLHCRMDWARLAAGSGDLEEAIRRATPVLEALPSPGPTGSPDYGHYVFERETLSRPMLPQLWINLAPDQTGSWAVEIAGWLGETGDVDGAMEVCRRVLDLIPDYAAAEACLGG